MGRKKKITTEKLEQVVPSDTLSYELTKETIHAQLNAFHDPDADLYLDKGYFKHPYSYESFRRLLAQNLVAWAERPTSFSIREWLNKYHLFYSTVNNWCKVDPYFREMYQLAKEIIGVRREMWGSLRKRDPTMMLRSMPIYSHDYKELKEWEASLADKKDQGPTTLNLFVNRVRDEQSDSSATSAGRDPGPELGDQASSGEADEQADDTQE